MDGIATGRPAAEGGGWAQAQHLEVLSRHRSTTTTPDMRAAMVHEEGGYAVAGKIVQENSEAESKSKGAQILKTTPNEQAAAEPRPAQS